MDDQEAYEAEIINGRVRLPDGLRCKARSYCNAQPKSTNGIRLLACTECERQMYITHCISCQGQWLVVSKDAPTANIKICKDYCGVMSEVD